MSGVTTLPSNVLNNFDRLIRSVEKVVSPGDFPLVQGLSKFAPLNIVHFDSHLDYSHKYQRVLLTHGSPIRRCPELPFVNQ